MKFAFLNILIGLAMAAVGIAVSVGSYAAVSRSGGHYVVAWGIVLVGAWRVLVGLYQLVRASFTAEGRASIGHFLWPARTSGRLLRAGFVLAVAVAVTVVGPESWTSFAPAPLLAYKADDGIKSLAYSPDGRWLALGLGYRGLSIIDAKTGAVGVRPALDPYTDIEAVAFSPDGKLLAAVAYNGLQVWTSPDWSRAAPTLVMRVKEGDYGVAFSPDGRTLATGSISKGLLVWDVEARALKWTSHTTSSVNGVAFSKDGARVASGDDGGIQIWDTASGKLVRTLRPAAYDYRPFTTIAFLRDGRVAAASYQKPDVSLWDSTGGGLLQTLRSTPRPWGGGSVWSIAAADDGRWIAGALSDGSVRVWDMSSDKPARTIFGHTKDVRSIALSPDGARIASGGGSDKALKVYASP